jgi:hypothetical protein
MRQASLLLLGCVLLAAVGCILFSTPQDPGDGNLSETISISMTAPTQTRTVAEGTKIQLSWSIFIESVNGATLTGLVERRPDQTSTVLFEGRALSSGSQSGSFEWATFGFQSGLYVIRLRVIRDGVIVAEARSAGDITIDGKPTLEFTLPTGDATLELNRSLEIAWRSRDPEAVATAIIGLDPDSDHESGNEITLTDFTLPAAEQEDMLEWRGEDSTGNRIDPNTYHLFSIITDEVSGGSTIDPGIRITIEPPAPDPNDPNQPVDPNDPNTPVEPAALGIRQPDVDLEFQTLGPDLMIEYGVGQSTEALVDLRVDSDQNNSNGNEQTILLQQLIEDPNGIGTFDWDGTDSSGDPIADGIYQLIIAVSQATGAPQTQTDDNLILLRSELTPANSGLTLERSDANWDVAEPETMLPIRRQAAAAYDDFRQRGVVFGGRANSLALGDTWFWQDNNWVAGPTGPSARFHAAMAHDQGSVRTILFGGINLVGTRNAETWSLNQTTWNQVMPALAPTARDGHAMVYDEARNQIVLFGGETAGGLNNETWTWNGTTWVQKNPGTSPSARRDMQMTFDRVDQRVVMFGGETAGGVSDETWIWDGDTWRRAQPTTIPPARSGHTLTFSDSLNRAVCQGGSDGTIAFDDTWEWNGNDWTEADIDPTGSGRQHAVCFFDEVDQDLVLASGAVGVPLVGVLAPANDQNVDPGNTLSIRWRDVDPTGIANIRVVYDDDDMPDEGTETDEDEVEILSTREALGDGVLDTFNWLVPQITPPSFPGRFFVFVYIDYYDEDAGMMREQVSVSAGRFIIRDPN